MELSFFKIKRFRRFLKNIPGKKRILNGHTTEAVTVKEINEHVAAIRFWSIFVQ